VLASTKVFSDFGSTARASAAQSIVPGRCSNCFSLQKDLEFGSTSKARMNRRELLKYAGGVASGGWLGGTFAQNAWPSRPIKLLLPFSSGGPTDTVARLVAVRLGERLRQPIVPENREGAGGVVAAELAVHASPDGYTLLFHSSGLAIITAIHRHMRFDPTRDLQPIGMVSTTPLVLVANNSLPAASPAEFFDYLRKNPGKLNYGSGGVGNATHVGMEQILQATHTSATHVAYKGTAPAMLALIGGQVQFMSDSLSTSLPYILDGRVRAVAILSKSRAATLPNVPTLSETLVRDLDQSAWQGIWAPKGTSPSIVSSVNNALLAVLAEPALKAQLERMNVFVHPSSPGELGTFLVEEIGRWKAVAQASGISVE
jgi:tripartite-type tricarboxylate transporter receptor subunit TctC